MYLKLLNRSMAYFTEHDEDGFVVSPLQAESNVLSKQFTRVVVVFSLANFSF